MTLYGNGGRNGAALYGIVFSYAAGLVLYRLNPLLFFGFGLAVPVWLLAGRDSVSLKGRLLCLVFMLLAGARFEAENPKHNPKHFIHSEPAGIYQVRLNENLQQRAHTFRAEAFVEALWKDSIRRECCGKIMVYFPKEIMNDSTACRPSYGDRLYLNVPLQPIEGFVGDDGKYFDYAAFMARKGIYAQCFLRDGKWKIEPWQCRGIFDFIRKKTLTLRARLGRFLENSRMEPQTAAVAKALILGEKSHDPIQDAYRNTGIVHLLAVSGMHLSIFALMAVRLFSVLGRKRWQKRLKFWLVNTLIWSYALLTGLAPSVNRAACMFTFVSLGKCIGRETQTERSLAVSALVQLVINPFLLQETGFLLSYSAVLGLVYISPLLAGIWRPRYKITQAAWRLIVASCSAQLATVPVILYSFGTFPTYFLLANLLVTPIVNVALPWGFVNVLLSCLWQRGALWLTYGLDFFIGGMNRIALWIGAFPGALVRAPLSLPSAVLFVLAVILFYRTFSRCNKRPLPIALCLLTLTVLIG